MALQVFLIHAPVYTCVMCTAVPVGSHGAVCGVEGPGMSFTSRDQAVFLLLCKRVFRECLNVDSSQEPQGSSVEGHVHLAPASSAPAPDSGILNVPVSGPVSSASVALTSTS